MCALIKITSSEQRTLVLTSPQILEIFNWWVKWVDRFLTTDEQFYSGFSGTKDRQLTDTRNRQGNGPDWKYSSAHNYGQRSVANWKSKFHGTELALNCRAFCFGPGLNISGNRGLWIGSSVNNNSNDHRRALHSP